MWNAGGLHLHLEGEANDYVGKGMAGGKIVLKPARAFEFVARETVIMGNTCLYGATGGELYAAGTAGERFAVRNSGALAVVEGAGDHCCEYMTGGVVCVLGRTGVNFGAGFTGGFAYVLDMERDFVDRYNHELIDIHRVSPEGMGTHVQHLRGLIEQHVEATGSVWGVQLLERFPHLHRQILGGEAEGGRDRFPARQSAPRRLSARRCRDELSMADKYLQFLDIPRKDPDKLAGRGAHHAVSRDLFAVQRRDRRRSRPAAACPAAIRSANGNARCTTTSRTGWRWSTRASCSRRRSCRIRPIPCRKCAVASVRRTGCARAPAR